MNGSHSSAMQLRTEMDIAAALTDVLTTRMKPPPKPPRDLYPSTAFWLLFTGIAIGLLGLTLFSTADHLKWVGFIGAGEMAAGYLWIIWLVFRRQPSSAALCALPPVTVWYLTRRRYRHYRPLRFVLTGAVLVALAGLAPYALSRTRDFAGAYERTGEPLPPDITTRPEVEQLREYREKRQIDKLVNLLHKLDRTDPDFSESAKNRGEIATELRVMCDPAKTSDTTVRAAALPAYARWSKGDDARAVVLTAVQGHPDERREAIRLLPRWRDADVARVLASRLGNRDESTLAKNALIDLGGSLAVQALIPILRNKDNDKVVQLAALDLLAHPRIGDDEAIAFLRSEKDKFTDQTLSRQAEQKILEIQNNQRQKLER